MRVADTGEAVTARGERDSQSPMGRVLVAEDDANIAEVLVSLLEEEGYAVTVCDDGHAVLTALDEPPGLVLLDVLLPGLNGVEVCRWLKADPRTPIGAWPKALPQK